MKCLSCLITQDNDHFMCNLPLYHYLESKKSISVENVCIICIQEGLATCSSVCI